MRATLVTFLLVCSIVVFPLLPRAVKSKPRLAGPDYVALINQAASGCRSLAAGLQKRIAACQQFLAANPGGTCTVTYGSRKFSVDMANSIAATFNAAAGEYESQLPAVEKQQIKVNADEAAIRALGFAQTAKDFEEWEKHAKAEQAEFQVKLAEVAIGNVLIGAKEAVKSVKSLNPWNAQKIIGKFKAAGLEDPKLNAAIRRLAATSAKGKVVWINDWQEVVENLKRVKDTFFLGVSAGKEGHIDKKLLLEAIATALTWLLKDPVLELIVADVQVAAAYAYAVTAVVQIDKLTALEETQLKSLSSLKTRTEDDWKALNAILNGLPKACSFENLNREVGQ